MVSFKIFLAALLLAGQVEAQPYHVKTAADLPFPSLTAAAENPLKGFVTSPLWVSPGSQKKDIPTTLDFYYIGLDTTMTGYNTFNWSYLESLLNSSASRNRHAILRFILDYPNDDDSPYVPQYLVNQGLQFDSYSNFGGGQSPDYTDPNLLTALEQFITAFGANYDGDTRIAFIQLGLIGFWGEWHTYPHNFLPSSTMTLVAGWYRSAFSITQLQGRYPDPMIVSNGFGLKDDSYTHATLSNSPSESWFFWPRVQNAGYTDFWRQSVMGGEVFPDNQDDVFSSGFSGQDFNLCTDTTHATYIIINYAFATGSSGQDLVRAKAAATRMGYAYRVSRVEVTSAANNKVDIKVEITLSGVAPFYYPLSLELSCDGMSTKSVGGVENIIDQYDAQEFDFVSVSATPACLQAVTLTLSSPNMFPGNPIKFAQGDGNVVLNIPPDSTCVPSCSGKECGNNGCGGSCGTCNSGETCNSSQQCVPVQCTPSCSGKDCGDNGCGGICGTCNSGETCDSAQQCVPVTSCGKEDFQNECTTTGQCQGMYAGAYDCWNGGGGVCYCGNGDVCGCLNQCTPSCSGKDCGNNGCGGSCGTCNSGETCNSSQQCVPVQCTPSCSGKDCGDNGCGGSCGTCSSGETCNSGQQCVPVTSCGREDFQNECTTTGQCKGMYAGAYDCWNGGGGVCYCGNGDVCGCL